MPGHAGNFLVRLFSLSPEILPQVPIMMLENMVVPEITDRAEYYSFSKVKQRFKTWQNFHRAWPDFYQKELFERFNGLFPEPFPAVIYAIHPEEFLILESSVIESRPTFYFVDLDERYHAWVAEQQSSLDFQYRPDYQSELEKFNILREKYPMSPISLTDMLDSTDLFLKEYLKICEKMMITPVPDAALRLYHDWYLVRGPGNHDII